MKFITKLTLVYLSIILISIDQAKACTTIIVSGRYTVDGRPLLFKQRDTPNLENKLVVFTDGKYKCVGIVNTTDTTNSKVWAGHNSEGFAIMNSASYNINPEGTTDDKADQSGQVMKLALQNCKTLADFENLLNSLPRPLNQSSNFGVIDAYGGAAYYETNNDGFVKFDVNDIAQAPLGYLIRTNFSFSGDRNRDKGLSRYNAANELLYYASMTNNLSYDYLINNVSRSLLHGITKVDLLRKEIAPSSLPEFVPFRDYIPRYWTASAIVTQGVKEDESPSLTTSWVTLGFPLITPTVPIILSDDVPTILQADVNGKSKLNEWTLTLKKQLFPIVRGEGNDYLDISELLIPETGMYYKYKPVNESISEKSEKYLNKWYKQNRINHTELSEFYRWVDDYLSKIYDSK